MCFGEFGVFVCCVFWMCSCVFEMLLSYNSLEMVMVLMEPILINGNIVCYVIEALRPEDCKLFFLSHCLNS